MIRVTIELISAVSPDRNRVLGIAEISNVRGTKQRADYRYKVFGKNGRKMHDGYLQNMPRLKTNAWDLLTILLTQERTEIIRKKLK